jgi:mannose-6-phosphate isomerase-like protein (cupin superfamily)
MQVIDNAQVRKFHMPGFTQQTLAGTESGMKSFEVWLTSLVPGRDTPPHRHPGEVVWLILRGSGRIVVDGKEVEVGPDTTVVIPPGASRHLVNTGKEDLVMFNIRTIVAA